MRPATRSGILLGFVGAAVLLLSVTLFARDNVASATPSLAPGDPPTTVSATGMGQVPADLTGVANALNIGVQERTPGTDLQQAVKTVQDKVATIQAALQQAGVPAT